MQASKLLDSNEIVCFIIYCCTYLLLICPEFKERNKSFEQKQQATVVSFFPSILIIMDKQFCSSRGFMWCYETATSDRQEFQVWVRELLFEGMIVMKCIRFSCCSSTVSHMYYEGHSENSACHFIMLAHDGRGGC